jgi:hypothetical protein
MQIRMGEDRASRVSGATASQRPVEKLRGGYFDPHNFIRRFAHFSPNPLKLLDRGFKELATSPLELIEYKGLIKMAEPRVYGRVL